MVDPADTSATVFLNGKVFISAAEPGTNAPPTEAPRFADCLVARGPLIEFVGASDAAEVRAARAAPSTRVVDLAGKTLLPGFLDGHMHLMLLGQSLEKHDLGACRSLADVQAAVRAHAAAHPDLPRLLFRGWMYSMTPGGVSARDLDGLDVPNSDRPVLIDSKDLHTTWANTTAVDALGAADWSDVPGGVIERDENGHPTGVFSEAANFTYVWPYLARVASVVERSAAVRAAVRAYHAAGYTGLVEMAMDEGGWDALQALLAEEKEKGSSLAMRIAAYWLIRPSATEAEALAQVDRAAELAARHSAETSPDCRVVGIKVICDGIIDACTAGLTEPYLSGDEQKPSPDPLWSREQLAPVVQRADEHGLQVALHAIGDATITMAADVLEAHASPARRPRMEHVELPSAADTERIGRLRVTASIQPAHSDPAILRAWPRLLGADRCARAFPYRELADHGAPLALGSDSPTAPHSPLASLYVAATRWSYREPALRHGVNEHFRLGLCEAAVAAAAGVAYSCFDDHRVGHLAPGLRADLVAVDMQWEETKLIDATVAQTWFDGEKVYDAENSKA